GREGVGLVINCGSNVRSVKPGDRVISIAANAPYGFWASHTVIPEADLWPVPETIATDQAAMLTINPITAWLLLHEFEKLAAGDWIIQNAANSAVGLWINHLAHTLNIACINCVRSEATAKTLRDAGIENVVIESPELSQIASGITKGMPIRLAINTIGGDSALWLSKVVANGGTVVTYGAMSKQPVTVPNALLIYRDIRFVGFLRSRWVAEHSPDQVRKIMARLTLNTPTIPVRGHYKLDDYQAAFSAYSNPTFSGKLLFIPG
ncbi:hypothetical protein EBR96_01030, partial [bacterium]|nr:hypothetical protein [bacterium]